MPLKWVLAKVFVLMSMENESVPSPSSLGTLEGEKVYGPLSIYMYKWGLQEYIYFRILNPGALGKRIIQSVCQTVHYNITF